MENFDGEIKVFSEEKKSFVKYEDAVKKARGPWPVSSEQIRKSKVLNGIDLKELLSIAKDKFNPSEEY